MAWKNGKRRYSKWYKSLAAHDRLATKHSRNRRSKRSRALASYHSSVYQKQLDRGVILSKKEKKAIYKSWVK